MADSRSAGRALLAAVSLDTTDEEVAAAFRQASHDRVAELAIVHRLPGLVHARLEATGQMRQAALEKLAPHRQRARAHHLAALRLTEQIADLLDEDWVLLKGPVLARAYGAIDYRSYVDLDILVTRDSFRDVFARLTGAGYESMNKNWQSFLDQGVAEAPLQAQHMVIDVHWHLLAIRADRQSFDLDADAMVARRTSLTFGSHDLPSLAPIDMLLHLCAHGGLGGGHRLVWLADLDRVIRASAIDWDTFVKRATAARMVTMAWMMLARSHRYLSTPVPASALEALRHQRLWPWVDQLINRSPRTDDRLAEGLDRSLFVRTARDDLPASTRALFRKLRNARQDHIIANQGGLGRLDWRSDEGGEPAHASWLDYVGSGAP